MIPGFAQLPTQIIHVCNYIVWRVQAQIGEWIALYSSVALRLSLTIVFEAFLLIH